MEKKSALLVICAGNSPVAGDFLAKASAAEFDTFFDLRLNERLNKQWWGWWFETPSHPLWGHSNEKMAAIDFRYQQSSYHEHGQLTTR